MPSPIRLRSSAAVSGAIRLAPVLLLSLLAAPGEIAPDARAGSPTTTPSTSPRTAPGRTPPPPGVSAEQIAPRRGGALSRAQWPLDRVRAGIDMAAPDAATAPAPPGPPPLAAQKAYARGRAAWRAGRPYDAIERLERAHRLAPNHVSVTRLLGRVYFEAGNPVRGARFLRQAVERDPDDPASLYRLGRFAVDRGDWRRAIGRLARAARAARGTPSERYLPAIQFALGRALEHEGHDRAAIAAYRGFLDRARQSAPAGPGQNARRRWLARRAVGDAWLRLDKPEAALAAYEAADRAEAGRLDGRIVHALLRLDRPAAARQRVIRLLKRADEEKARDRGLELAAYLGDELPDRGAWGDQLRRVYREAGRSTELALAIAELLDERAALELLGDHLERRPADDAVFDRYVEIAVSAERIELAADRASRMVALRPDAAGRWARELVERVADPAEVARALADQDSHAAAFVRGVAWSAAGRPERARAAWRDAVKGGIAAARLELARARLARGRLEAAGELLRDIEPPASTEALTLKARWLERSGKPEAALEVVEQALERRSGDVELTRRKARLLWRHLDRVSEAERVLLDALNRHPRAEALYSALFEIYDSSKAPSDAVKQYKRLMRRLLRTMPQSRLARLKRAELLIHRSREGRTKAEKILRELLDANPADTRALALLLNVLRKDGRQDAAERLLAEHLERRPRDADLLRAARRHYRQTGQTKRARSVTERLIRLENEGPRQAAALARLHLGHGEPGKALDLLSRALAEAEDEIDPTPFFALMARAAQRAGAAGRLENWVKRLADRHPDHAPDVRYHWAMFLTNSGRTRRAEAVLSGLLDRHPDHPQANNALGYSWIDDGKKLDRAIAMVKKALDADPDNAAYLDSLGWGHYKRGDFRKAVTWLKRAMAETGGAHPVIHDHLGDALYRLGKRADARRHWRKASEQLKPLNQEMNHELRGLDERIAQKLAALKRGGDPPVASSPGAGGAGEENKN